jgi:hypothetical protein
MKNLKSILSLFLSAVICAGVFASTYVTGAAKEEDYTYIAFRLSDYLEAKNKADYTSKVIDKIKAAPGSLKVDIFLYTEDGVGDRYINTILNLFLKYESRIISIGIRSYESNNLKPLLGLSKFTKLRELTLDYSYNFDMDYSNFVDLPNVTSLDIGTIYDNKVPFFKHFPNVTNYGTETGSTHYYEIKLLLTSFKKLKTINNIPLQEHDAYIEFFDKQLRDTIDKGNFKQGKGTGAINGKFLITVYHRDRVYEPFRGDEINEWFPSTDEYADQYAKNTNKCDTYVLITSDDEAYGSYGALTIGYKSTYKVQIFDLKNKIKYEEFSAGTSYPPYSISAQVGAVYGKTPQKLYDFLLEACKKGKA